MEVAQINFLEDFKDLFDESLRYIVYYGGRCSGKSYHAALALLLRGRDKRLRILCTREIQNTIKDSVHKLLKDLIEEYGMNDYVITNDSIYNTRSQTEFIFKGLKRNIAEIKSLQGVDICWMEEAQSITAESLNVLTPTIMRHDGAQIIATFNRITHLDPIYVKYCTKPIKKCLAKEVNYDVLEKVGLLSEVTKDEIEEDRLNNPELYLWKWLGQPLSQLDNAIISRSDILEAMNKEVSDEGSIAIGVDVARFGSDRTVIWKRKGLKTIDYKIYEKLRTDEVADKVEEMANYDLNTSIKVDDTGVGCITENTKILTPMGWKLPKELKTQDLIYSKDSQDKVISVPIGSILKKTTNILESKGYEFSWCHLVPYRTRLDNTKQLKSWQEILKNKQIIFDSDFHYMSKNEDFTIPQQTITMPHGGTKIINQAKTISGKDFCSFLGWYLSEGYFDRKTYCLSIAQNKNKHFDEIVRLSSLLGKPQIKKNGNGFSINIFNRDLYKWIKQHCYKNGYGFKYKTVPRFVSNNSAENINSFLESFKNGDGYDHRGQRCYVTSSIYLVDDLTELIFKIGKKASNYLKNIAGSKFIIEGREATRTENSNIVFEMKNNKNGNYYGLSHFNVTEKRGTVYSLVIDSPTKMMFTKCKNAKPIWTHNGGVSDQLIRKGYNNIIPINFGSSASDKDKYNNLISEAWFYLSSIVKDIQLPEDKDLLMELSTRTWKLDGKERRCVESKADYKKKGYRSPDLADACILCYFVQELAEPEIHFI